MFAQFHYVQVTRSYAKLGAILILYFVSDKLARVITGVYGLLQSHTWCVLLDAEIKSSQNRHFI